MLPVTPGPTQNHLLRVLSRNIFLECQGQSLQRFFRPPPFGDPRCFHCLNFQSARRARFSSDKEKGLIDIANLKPSLHRGKMRTVPKGKNFQEGSLVYSGASSLREEASENTWDPSHVSTLDGVNSSIIHRLCY